MAQPTELPAEIDLWREVEVVQNGQAKIYYHNTKTNDVSWNIPTTQWRKVKSSEGKLYYVNSSSLATSWASPPECTLIVEFFATKALSRSLPPSPTAAVSASTSGSSPTNVSHTAPSTSPCSHHSHHCHHCHHHHKKRSPKQSPKQSPHTSPKVSPHTSPKHKTRSVRGHSHTSSSASSSSIPSISTSLSPSLSSTSSSSSSVSSTSSSPSSSPPSSPPPIPIPPPTVGGAFAPPSPHSLPPIPTPPSTAPPSLTPTPPPTPPPVLVALLPSSSPVPPPLLPPTPTGQQSLNIPQPPILPSPPRDRPPSPSPQTLSVRGSPFKGLGPPPPPPPLPPLFNPTTPQGPISDSPKFFPASPSLQQKASQEGVSCIDCRLYGGAGRCPMHRSKQSPEKGAVSASQIQTGSTDLPDPLEEDDKSFALDNSGNGSTTATTVTVTQPRGSNELNGLESKSIAGLNIRSPYKGDLKSLNNFATFSIKKAATLKQAKGYKKKFDEYWFSVTAKGRIEYFKDPGMSKKLGRLVCNQSIVTQIDKSDGEFLFTVRDQKFHVYQAPSKKERDEWLYIFQDHGADVRPILIQGVLVEAPKKGKEVPRWGVLYKKKFQYFKSRSDELPLGEINFTTASALKIHPNSDQLNGTSVVAGTRKFTILGEGGEKNSFDGWASSVEEERKWFDILTLIMDSKATRRVQVEVLDGKDFTAEHIYCSVLPVREDPITNKITEVREELQKTPIAEGSGDPVWNTAMVFRSNIPEKGSLLFRVKSKKGVQTNYLGEATLAYDFTKPNPGRVESWLLLQAPRKGTLKGAERFGSIRISLLLCEPKTSPPLQPQRMTLKVQSSPQQIRKRSEDIEE